MPSPIKTPRKPKSEAEIDNLVMEKTMSNLDPNPNPIPNAEPSSNPVPAPAVEVHSFPDILDPNPIPIRNPSHIIQVDCRPIPASKEKELENELKDLMGSSADYHGCFGGNQSVVTVHAYRRDDAVKALQASKLLSSYALDLMTTDITKPGNPTVKKAFSLA